MILSHAAQWEFDSTAWKDVEQLILTEVLIKSIS